MPATAAIHWKGELVRWLHCGGCNLRRNFFGKKVTTVWKAILMAALCITVALPLYAGATGLGDVRISLIEGDVQILTADTQEWVAASINMPLAGGDRIWAPEGSRAELHMSDGTYVRLNERTSLDLLTVERESFQFYLNLGQIYVNFREIRDGLVQIDTPVSTVRAYDSARFRVDVREDGSTDVSVFRGVVNVEHRSGGTGVREGQVLSVTGYSFSDLRPLGPQDSWERWNRDRDRRLSARGQSYRYLPEELAPYGHDFDSYGKWVQVRDYGYCWTPTVSLSVGWSPYRYGRWVWVRGDYVWVSYDSWGWVPHHYGRWVYVSSHGWCWVPPVRGAVYWGPGYVGWVSTPTYVSWVPLAPGEIYYGHGHYGPHSVNITNVNVNNIVIKNVYRNVSVTNAVTVVHRDTFLTGKQVDVRVRENPFLRERPSIGRPDIKPERRTVAPLIRDIPAAKQPPTAVRELKTGELKESRPLVKDRTDPYVKPRPAPKAAPERQKEYVPSPVEKERQRQAASPVRKDERPKETKPPADKASEKARESRVPPPRVQDRPSGIKQQPQTTPGQQGSVPAPGPATERQRDVKSRQLQPAVPAGERLKESPRVDQGKDQARPAAPPAANGHERTRDAKQPVDKGNDKARQSQTEDKGDKQKDAAPGERQRDQGSSERGGKR
jgi:hypothetical protein